jgi:hypothetical protein
MTTFLIIFLCALIAFGVSVYLVTGSTKKKVQAIIDKAKSLGSTQYIHFAELPIKYWFSNGNRHYPSINNVGDIFIFEDFILVIRKQQFLTARWLKPLVISFRNLNYQLGGIESFAPNKFVYWEQQRKEVQIHLVDKTHSHNTSPVTLRKLDKEKINELKAFEQRTKPVDFSSTNR